MGIIQKLAYFFVLLQNRFCIMMEQDKKIYSEAVVEFVTVSAEYCKRLETCQEFGRMILLMYSVKSYRYFI